MEWKNLDFNCQDQNPTSFSSRVWSFVLICFSNPKGERETHIKKIIISYSGTVMSLWLLQESELMARSQSKYHTYARLEAKEKNWWLLGGDQKRRNYSGNGVSWGRCYSTSGAKNPWNSDSVVCSTQSQRKYNEWCLGTGGFSLLMPRPRNSLVKCNADFCFWEDAHFSSSSMEV